MGKVGPSTSALLANVKTNRKMVIFLISQLQTESPQIARSQFNKINDVLNGLNKS